jgi:hypoxanthine-guanine phosphoribosyltransferase
MFKYALYSYIPRRFWHLASFEQRDVCRIILGFKHGRNIKQFVHVDTEYFRGKKVLVIDDIYTTGQSSSAFIREMEDAGASVIGALFLAKTVGRACP